MAVNRVEEFSAVQQNAGKGEFFQLLDEYPELDQIYNEKKVKKLPFEWRDIVLARVANPKIPLDQVWDAYKRGFIKSTSEEAKPATDQRTESNKHDKKDHDDHGEIESKKDIEKGFEQDQIDSEGEGKEEESVGRFDDVLETKEERLSEDTVRRSVEDGGSRKDDVKKEIAKTETIATGKDAAEEKSEENEDETTKERDLGKDKLRKVGISEAGIRKLEEMRREYERAGETVSVPLPSYAPTEDIRPTPLPFRVRAPQREDRGDGGLGLARKIRAARTASGGRGAFSFLRGFFRPGLKNILQVVGRVVAVIPGGKIVIIVIALFILLAFFIINQSSTRFVDEEADTAIPGVPPGSGGQGDDGDGGASPIPGLDLGKAGPTSGEVGSVVEYTITAEYDGSLDVLVYDPIAPNAEYVSSDPPGEYDEVQRVISWRLVEQEADFVDGDLRTYNFQLSLRPIIDNITITNQAFASASLPTGVVLPPNLDATTFEDLMEGQGRNTGILGSEDEFIEAIFANAGRRFADGGGRSVYEPYLRDLYRISVENNVNPVIVLTIWGVEQSHRFVDGYEFGCLDADLQGFSNQVRCSVETLNKWMADFEEKAAVFGLPVTATIYETCAYRDPFVYAYEWYTPVCTMNHGNDNARRNFIIYYKEFLQGPS